MLKYSLHIIKNNTARKTSYTINKSGQSLEILMTTSKIDDIIFRGGAHTQNDPKQGILNLTGSESHPHVSAMNFACWSS